MIKPLKKMKRSKVQIFRWLSLLSVIFFFVLVPLSNKYANYKISYNNARLVEMADGKIAGFTYRVLDSVYSLWENPVDAATSNNGSLWAYSFFGLPMSDPLGLVSELINSVKFPANYLLGGIIPLLVTLLFGRIFCSWICPMTVVFTISRYVRAAMEKIRFPLLQVSLPHETRVILFWAGLVISYITGAWVWHFILPYISFSHEIFSIVVFSTFSVGIYFLVALIVLDIGLIPGEFCRSVCPTGYFLSVADRFSVFRLKADSANCPKSCNICQRACPYDLFPRTGELKSCHLCFKCVDNCPKDHIQLKLNDIYTANYSKTGKSG